MKRTVLLLASMALVVLLACGAALAVVPRAPAAGDVEASAAASAKGPDAALDRALKELVRMEGGPPGVIAVALMLEDATGRTYEGQLQEQVYGPLGLRKTSLPSGPDLREPFIHGYNLSLPEPDVSEDFAAGWAWASGGIVSTPAELNTFIRGYVKGQLYDLETQREQRQVFEGGGSDPLGPGQNSAGLGVFRYETSCGTVWGHTGNTSGYTQFMAASPDGKRSATVSINAQIAPPVGDPKAFEALRRAEKRAVCAALAR